MNRTTLRGRRVVCVALVVLQLIVGCASTPRPGSRPAGAVADGELVLTGRPRTGGMLLVREAQLQLEVKDVEAAAHQIAGAVESAGGYPEDLRIDIGKGAVMVFRVPAATLDVTLARLEAHGRVKHKRVSAHNVTDQAVDLQARVETLHAAAELATLTVTLERPVRLGPLAWAGNGLAQLTSKLFVLQD